MIRTPLLCWLVIVSSVVDGGSRCPPRSLIDPCICNEITLKNSHIFTLVTCSSFTSAVDFDKVPRLLNRLLIDRLVIADYNSPSSGEITLPNKWAEHFRIRELEFYKVRFSRTVLAENSLEGQENVLEKFSLRNIFPEGSTLCSTCDGLFTTEDRYGDIQRQVTAFPEVDLTNLKAMENLRELDLSWNGFESLENPIPAELTNLQFIDLSHNKILRIYPEAFREFKSLRVIKLSHNKITSITANMFDSGLSLIDFSYNLLTELPENMFENITLHSQVLFAHNNFQTFPMTTWMPAVKLASIIDVSENFFICDCSMAWILDQGKSNIIGNCTSPREVELLPLKKAALKQKCDADVQNAIISDEI